ncbi:MAG TPA: hypothetical protein VLW85_02145 [Myxococcales bacterium]|nr:hypothetical protein [Myxococcales bacterium]
MELRIHQKDAPHRTSEGIALGPRLEKTPLQPLEAWPILFPLGDGRFEESPLAIEVPSRLGILPRNEFESRLKLFEKSSREFRIEQSGRPTNRSFESLTKRNQTPVAIEGPRAHSRVPSG